MSNTENIEWPKDEWGYNIYNVQLMEKAGYSEVEVLKAKVAALGDLLESFPTGLCDMGIHLYCDPERYCEEWPEI